MFGDLESDIHDTLVYTCGVRFNYYQLDTIHSLVLEMHDKLIAIRYYTRQAKGGSR